MVLWEKLSKDKRYIDAPPEKKLSVQQKWFDDNIKPHPRYTPEQDTQLRARIFKDEPVVAFEPKERTLGNVVSNALRGVSKIAQPVIEQAQRLPTSPQQVVSDQAQRSPMRDVIGRALKESVQALPPVQEFVQPEGYEAGSRVRGMMAYPYLEGVRIARDVGVSALKGGDVRKAFIGEEQHSIAELLPKAVAKLKTYRAFAMNPAMSVYESMARNKTLDSSIGWKEKTSIDEITRALETVGEIALASTLRGATQKVIQRSIENKSLDVGEIQKGMMEKLTKQGKTPEQANVITREYLNRVLKEKGGVQNLKRSEIKKAKKIFPVTEEKPIIKDVTQEPIKPPQAIPPVKPKAVYPEQQFQDIVTKGGGIYKGVQETGKEPLILFNDATGNTLALKPTELTPENVKSKLSKKVAPTPEPPYIPEGVEPPIQKEQYKIGDNVEFIRESGTKGIGTIDSISPNGIPYILADGASTSYPVKEITKIIPTKYVGEKEKIKQPYDLTKKEYVNKMTGTGLDEKQRGDAHKILIEEAIKEGKIKLHQDYPELQKPPTPPEVVQEKIEKPKKIEKGKIIILPNKQALLSDIEKAISKATVDDLERPAHLKKADGATILNWSKQQVGTTHFKVDGGADIINTKKALREFYNNVKKQPATISSTGGKPVVTPKAIAFEKPYKELYKSPKGYVSDATFIIRGEAPKGAKYKDQPLSSEQIDSVMSQKGTPAEFKNYISTGEVEANSPRPIPKMEGTTQYAIVKSEHGYSKYSQGKFHLIKKNFPNAKITINDKGMLLFVNKGRTVAALMPVYDEGREVFQKTAPYQTGEEKEIVTQYPIKPPQPPVEPKPVELPKEEPKPKVVKEAPKKKTGGGSLSSAPAAAAQAKIGYGVIENSEKASKTKQAKTDYSKVVQNAPTVEETNLIQEALKIVSPATVSGTTRETAHIVRKGLAELAHKDVVAIEAMKKAHDAFTWMSREDAYKFIDDLETGKAQSNPKLQKFATTMRGLLDGRKVDVQNLGKGHLESFFENYFPHIWKDPKQAKNVIMQIMGRKRLEGTKTFLKKRTIMTVKDGIDRGLEPVSDNPVDLVLLKLHEMDRYIMAQNIIKDMKSRRLIKFVYSRGKPPEGYTKINDNAFTVYMPPEMIKKEAYDKIVVEQLLDIGRSLNIDTQRFVSIGGRRLGYMQPGAPPEKVRTKFASPESVLAHEIGHVIGIRYGVYDMFRKSHDTYPHTYTRGKQKGATVQKPTAESIEWRKKIDKQWRDLADRRFAGVTATQGYKNYVRNAREKEAVLLEALIHAPKLFKEVAPDIHKMFSKFLNEHGNLRPLLDIEPSLVLSTSDAKIAVPGFTTLGHYYAPNDVALLLNNHLSPGLRNAKNKLISGSYNILRGAGNILNQINLSLSLFHGLNVTTDMMASTVGLGLRKLQTKGQFVSGLKDIAIFPVAAVTNIWEGTRLKKAYRQQLDTITDPKLKQMVESIITAGGRDRMDVFYYNRQVKALTKTLSDVIKGTNLEKLAGLAKLPFNVSGSILEVLAKPLMEWYVPTGKMGLFSKLAQHEMMRAEAGQITDEQLIDRLTSVWDSVDNRMGQLIYDNLFWNKYVKDTLMMVVRSVGWNLGSWREYAGAGLDLFTVFDRIKRGDKFFSQKMSYVIGAVIVYSLLGATIQYLLTGKKPEETKDYFFPKTGNKNTDGSDERLSLPTYAKDVYSYSQQPLKTLKHKMHPLIPLISDLTSNKDFFNVEVADRDDDIFMQMKDTATHIKDQAQPFSFKNYQKMSKVSDDVLKNVMISITGITSAPSYLTRSPAQKLMYRYIVEGIPDKAKSKEDFERSGYRRQYLSRKRKGEPVSRKEAISILGVKSVARLDREAMLEPFAASFKRLSFENALDVYSIASPQEKAQARSILMGKRNRATKTTKEMIRLYNELM